MTLSNNHIHRDYHISKVLAICFTLLYFIVCSISFMVDSEVISDAVEIVAALLYYLVPTLVVLTWYMYVERYMYLNLMHCEPNDSESLRKQLGTYIRHIVFAGVVSFVCALANVYFFVNFWEYIGEIYIYYIIVLVVTVGWFVNLCMCIKRIDRIKADSRMVKLRNVLVTIFLTVVSMGCLTYAMSEAASVAFLKSVQ